MKKTNALRMLDKLKVRYEVVTYPVDERDLSGAKIISYIPLPKEAIFKTLVLKGERKGIMVVMIAVLDEIDLKKLAIAVEDKKVEMLAQKDLLATTGYVRGGCSPIGMKKRYPTYIDQSVEAYDRISVSAGDRGMQMIISRDDLVAVSQARLIDIRQCKR